MNTLPGAISGSSNICQDATTTLHDATTGGTWSSSDPTIADIGSATGIVRGVATGTVIITYTLGSGCNVTAVLNVYAAPAAITGTPAVCVGGVTLLSEITPGGDWSSTNPAAGTISPAGLVSGIAAGTTTISYTMTTTTGCAATMVVSVNPFPAAITGSPNVCEGSSTTLGDAVPGGTWSSSDPTVATAGSATGIVTGISGTISGGLATITYTLGAGCNITKDITVNPLPLPVSGPGTVCVAQSISLTDPTPAGIWSSTVTTIGTIDVAGNVTGLTTGVTTISYTNSFGCAATHNVTVNTMPSPIAGSSNVCIGGTTHLSDTAGGGLWWSTNTAVAAIGSSSGIVSGLTLGTTTIIYQLPAGCFVTKNINVQPLPTVFTVTGGGSHCAGDIGVHIGLTGSSTGVNYLLYLGATAVGTFAGTGAAMDFGLHTVGGTYMVTGTSTATGCTVNMAGSAIVGVIPSVTPVVNMNVTPNDTICAGATATFTTTVINGGTSPTYGWTVNGTPVALTTGYSFIPADGDVVMVTMTSNAVCPLPATVSRSIRMTVLPFANPAVTLEATPNDTICLGTEVHANAVTTYAGAAPTYAWIKNNVPQTVTTGVFSWVPNDGDVIYCVLSSNYPCSLSGMDTSAKLKIRAETPELVVVTITASAGTAIGPGQTDTLTATATNTTNPTWQWYVNGIPVAGATTNTFVSSSYSYPKEDSISCMVTSNGVCTISAHQWVYIKVTSVGVPAITGGSDISILPNPNKGTFTIKGSLGNTVPIAIGNEEVTLELTDMLGQVVYKDKLTAKGGKLNEQIKLSEIANGMYILSLRSEAGIKVFHLVIEQ